MTTPKRAITSLTYCLLLIVLIDLAFIIGGVISLLLVGTKISSQIVLFLIFLLLWKGIVAAMMVWFVFRIALMRNKETMIYGIGAYTARYSGLIIGGFLGARIADLLHFNQIVGGIAGVLILYGLGWWLGLKLGRAIAGQLDRIFVVKENSTASRNS